MSLYRTKWKLLCLSFLLVVLLKAQTPPKPDFSGVWKLNLQRSSLQSQAPTLSTCRIEHKEPQFHLERTHIYGEKGDAVIIDLTTDSKEVYRKEANLESWTRLYWEGNTLVLSQKLKLNGKDGTNLVRYSLADNGRTFIAVERMRTPKFDHYNYWVFEKQ